MTLRLPYDGGLSAFPADYLSSLYRHQQAVSERGSISVSNALTSTYYLYQLLEMNIAMIINSSLLHIIAFFIMAFISGPVISEEVAW